MNYVHATIHVHFNEILKTILSKQLKHEEINDEMDRFIRKVEYLRDPHLPYFE